MDEGTFTFPPDWRFVIGVSGQVAEKTGDKKNEYNDAFFLNTECRDIYNKQKGTTFSNLAEVITLIL